MLSNRLAGALVLVLAVNPVSPLAAQVPAGVTEIQVAIEATGVREVRATFANVAGLPDATLAYLTRGSALVLSVESDAPMRIVEEAQSLLVARGVERMSIVAGPPAGQTHVHLTSTGTLLLTAEVGADRLESPEDLLRTLLPAEVVSLDVIGDVPMSVVSGVSGTLMELGARTTIVRQSGVR